MGWEERMRATARASWGNSVRIGEDDAIRFGDVRAALAALDAARAEIERLRTAAADERADVVAWLMRQGWVIASNAINRGAHVGAAKGANHG